MPYSTWRKSWLRWIIIEQVNYYFPLVFTKEEKGSAVLKAYVHKGVREGEKFSGNFNDMICGQSHIQN